MYEVGVKERAGVEKCGWIHDNGFILVSDLPKFSEELVSSEPFTARCVLLT
jgi:hypothetical protein